jgi:hypothetical protein
MAVFHSFGRIAGKRIWNHEQSASYQVIPVFPYKCEQFIQTVDYSGFCNACTVSDLVCRQALLKIKTKDIPAAPDRPVRFPVQP